MNADSQTSIERPSLYMYFTDAFRAIKESFQSLAYRQYIHQSPHADGHPVFVIPGFMTSDSSTIPLRKFIQKSGYQPYGWGLGVNKGRLEYEDLLIAKIEELYEKHQQQVSIIGWSLGGIYARQIAKRAPEKIRQIITMGAPFAGLTAPNNATWIYRLISFGSKIEDLGEEWLADLPKPAQVPSTAIYSKKDGIVNWKVCMEPVEDQFHQNIEAGESHLGFGTSKEVLQIIVDRLQYDSRNWKKYTSA